MAGTDNDSGEPQGTSSSEQVGLRRPQFTIGFLLLLMIVTAIAALGIRQLLIAWKTPSHRAILSLVTITAPTLILCVVSFFYWLACSFSRRS